MLRQETTQSWTYDVAQLRQANGNTLNQVAYVQPVSGRKLSARVIGVADNSNADMVRVSVGIGIDSNNRGFGHLQNPARYRQRSRGRVPARRI
jgi:hypothetical protein